MKRILKKAGILLLVFLLGTAGTALLLNSESTDNRSDFNDAVFPEVMVDMNDTLINRMYGYAQPMQADFTRDSVTPLDTSKKLTFKVNPYDSEVKSFSYEIRTSDGSKVLENKKIKNLVKEDQYLSVDVEIGSDLRMNQEYSMQIALELDEGTAYYYTRVVSRSQVHASDYAAFVKYFYEACLDKESADALGSYLEPQTTGAATNYSGININSSLSEISWGNLAPQLCQEGIPVIKEINETTASVVLEYQLTSQNEDEETELYDVKEFYRMKYQDTRIYLLDFQRSANQVFDGTLPVYEDDGIILGVRDKNVEYMMNDAATVIAFVQEGDLWSYSPGNEKVNQVFSFRKLKDGDFRDSRTQHDIKIVRVTDEGDIDFVLYGYMNRGSHEGYEGIAVYHYNRDKNVVEERAFIPVSESFEFLKKDLEKLSYVNEKNVWYKSLNKALFMETLIERHGHIMDEYDPEKKIGMIVDEWGAWYTVEPGTNPGFLYQQNTMRDALIAGITLNIFNKHSDRVKMANLAQIVNVLQSVILTDGADMILTPTYHVFDMYKYHQDAMLVDSSVETETIGVEDEWQVPNLTESVSVAEDGAVHITLTNLSLDKDYEIRTILTDYQVNEVKGEIVHGEMHEMNTFETPDQVRVKEFNEVEKTAEGIKFIIPKCSVLHLEVR